MVPVTIRPGDSLPIYRQIVEQIKGAVASGLVKSGDKLPSHRELARQIVVAPLTVKKAYDTLEDEGVIATRRGLGTFVAHAPRHVGSESEKALQDRLAGLVHQARILGLSQRELYEKVRFACRSIPG
jgi:GntR family transcriptional regulator